MLTLEDQTSRSTSIAPVPQTGNAGRHDGGHRSPPLVYFGPSNGSCPECGQQTVCEVCGRCHYCEDVALPCKGVLRSAPRGSGVDLHWLSIVPHPHFSLHTALEGGPATC